MDAIEVYACLRNAQGTNDGKPEANGLRRQA
jgi:hypothetical protein